MYFKTLGESNRVVQQKHGFSKAWLSSAAMYDFVPGVIMAVYFGQLWLLGSPLRAVWGSGGSAEDYAKEYTGDKAPVEELLVRTGIGASPPDWQALGACDVRQLQPELYTVLVPTFKPLTTALLALAARPDVEVLRISNQGQVQVRVHVWNEGQMALLRAKKGVEVMFVYTFPIDGSGKPPPTSASLCVDVPYLLGAIRFCSQTGITVMQVYDFWS